MSFGSRLFRALRANVGHAVRRLGRDASDDPVLDPEFIDYDPGAPGPEPDPGQKRRRPSAAAGRARREELEKAFRALELPFGASEEEIRQAHRKLMRQFHPDRFAQEPERLADATRLSQELTVARDTLIEAHEKGLL